MAAAAKRCSVYLELMQVCHDASFGQRVAAWKLQASSLEGAAAGQPTGCGGIECHWPMSQVISISMTNWRRMDAKDGPCTTVPCSCEADPI